MFQVLKLYVVWFAPQVYNYLRKLFFNYIHCPTVLVEAELFGTSVEAEVRIGNLMSFWTRVELFWVQQFRSKAFFQVLISLILTVYKGDNQLTALGSWCPTGFFWKVENNVSVLFFSSEIFKLFSP